MAQVQFFQGTYDKLLKARLREGAIYFIPEERRLYIDTATRRVPVIGSAGLSLYVRLNANDWNDANQQTVTQYATERFEEPSLHLSNVLGDAEEAIVFMGTCYQIKNGVSTKLSEDYYVSCASV